MRTPAWKQAQILAIGVSFITVTNYVIDYVLYPLAIWYWGILYGGVLMTLLTAAACLALIALYDITKQDWLGIEAVKSIRDYDGASRSGRLLRWAMRRGDVVLFLMLAIRFDPLITTLFMRRDAHAYDGLKRRDWQIFFASVIVGNGYWTLTVALGIGLVDWVIQRL